MRVLEPLQIVTTILCADQEITASSVIPVIFSLCQKFLLPGLDDSDVIKQFKDHVSTELKLRFNLESDDLFQSPLVIASFLDP